MSQETHDRYFANSPAENYERYFVASIGGPVAKDLIGIAALRPGKRVLDVACGTGVVTRLAAEQIGAGGSVAGLDVDPSMLAVARSTTPAGMSIDWYESSAEAMPLPDASFDVVLCQMGLQFFPKKPAAMREVYRVLAAGGRAVISVAGPTPPLFAILAEALARHVGSGAASFCDRVFSMSDARELRALTEKAGFEECCVRMATRTLGLPAAEAFLWQYICSTPLAEAIAPLDAAQRAGLTRDVCAAWQPFEKNGALTLEVGMMTAIAVKQGEPR